MVSFLSMNAKGAFVQPASSQAEEIRCRHRQVRQPISFQLRNTCTSLRHPAELLCTHSRSCNIPGRKEQPGSFRCSAVASTAFPSDIVRIMGDPCRKRPTEASRRFIAAAKLKAAAFGTTDTCRNITWQEGAVSRTSKEQLLGQRGCVIWFTGLSGSGKSTVAITLEHALAAHGRLTTLLDGDNIRHGLNSNLGFSPGDREENIRRIGEVAKLMMESGIMTIASFISPYQKDRDLVRARIPPNDFVEVYMDVPLHICEQRDPKGLYKLARAGKLKCFTGIDDPYEVPPKAEIVLEYLRPDGALNTPDDMAAAIVDYLHDHGFLPPDAVRSCTSNNGC